MRKFNILFSFFCLLLVQTTNAQSFEKAVISNLSIVNSAKLDFAPTFHKDGIVFISNGVKISGVKKMQDKRINQKGLSILIAKKDEKGTFQQPELFSNELVTLVHDGPLTFSQDYKTVYFSRNNNRRTLGIPKYVSLVDRMQIYKSELTDKGWSKPRRLFFGDETKDYCHPALSPDGKKLYFSSNRKGTLGGMDLFVCTILPNGKYSKPVNLGAAINSDKDDAFPFIHQDGSLYFSSNKKGGAGGYDIYVARQTAGSTDFNTPLSIGAPFNSATDDFGFIINPEKKMGYFSSNRNGGVGEDDIYSFVIQDKPDEPQDKPLPVTLTFLDRKTQEAISNAEVTVVLENNNSPLKLRTDDKGQVKFNHDLKYNYEVTVKSEQHSLEQFKLEKEDTRPEITILANKIKTEKPADVVVKENTPTNTTIEEKPKVESASSKPSVPMNPVVINEPKPSMPTPKPITIDKSMSNESNDTFFKINKIFYDFDKSNIRKDASSTLDEMVSMLNQYPELMIEIEAHTDKRGSAEYNKKLSERRAYSAEQYLIKHGISSSRIRRVARGKDVLINDCVKCTENLHQANRRAEIRIVKYGK